MTVDTLLTRRDVAALLRLSGAAVYDLTARGELPVVQRAPGCALRYERAAVEAWIAAHRVAPKVAERAEAEERVYAVGVLPANGRAARHE